MPFALPASERSAELRRQKGVNWDGDLAFTILLIQLCSNPARINRSVLCLVLRGL